MLIPTTAYAVGVYIVYLELDLWSETAWGIVFAEAIIAAPASFLIVRAALPRLPATSTRSGCRSARRGSGHFSTSPWTAHPGDGGLRGVRVHPRLQRRHLHRLPVEDPASPPSPRRSSTRWRMQIEPEVAALSGVSAVCRHAPRSPLSARSSPQIPVTLTESRGMLRFLVNAEELRSPPHSDGPASEPGEHGRVLLDTPQPSSWERARFLLDRPFSAPLTTERYILKPSSPTCVLAGARGMVLPGRLRALFPAWRVRDILHRLTNH